MTAEFTPFPKIPRLNREVIVTEKIDGTNAAVKIVELTSDDALFAASQDPNCTVIRAGLESGDAPVAIYAQSRSRFIVPGKDNFGFAGWVAEHAAELVTLGPGTHFGEWWGVGIQRGYGLTERRFSLFHTHGINALPACVSVVPKLDAGLLSTGVVERALNVLSVCGSVAAPGFTKPEGVVVYHTAGRNLFKALLEGDDQPKGVAA